MDSLVFSPHNPMFQNCSFCLVPQRFTHLGIQHRGVILGGWECAFLLQSGRREIAWGKSLGQVFSGRSVSGVGYIWTLSIWNGNGFPLRRPVLSTSRKPFWTFSHLFEVGFLEEKALAARPWALWVRTISYTVLTLVRARGGGCSASSRWKHQRTFVVFTLVVLCVP